MTRKGITLKHGENMILIEESEQIRRSDYFTEEIEYPVEINADYDPAAVQAFASFIKGVDIDISAYTKELYFLSFEYKYKDLHEEVHKYLCKNVKGNLLLEYLIFSLNFKVSPPSLTKLVSAHIVPLSQLPQFATLPLPVIMSIIESNFASFDDSVVVELASRLYGRFGDECLCVLKYCSLRTCDIIALSSLHKALDPRSVYYGLVEALVNERVAREAAEVANKKYAEAMELAVAGEVEQANYILGKMYLRGTVLPRKLNVALERFRAGARDGHAKCAYNAGKMLQAGMGTHKDLNAATKYYKIAARNGDEELKLKVVNQIVSELELYNLEKATRIVQSCAKTIEAMVDDAWPEALFTYAVLLRDGIGVRRDLLEAIQYFMKAAANNHDDCDIEILKIQLFEGTAELATEEFERGVRLHSQGQCEDGVESFKLAADAGHVLAMCAYAAHLQKGEGVEQNSTEAAKYYRMAAERGNHHAQCNYGFCLLAGKGVETNNEEAAKFFRMSAEGGDISGMVNYGAALMHGKGVPQDYTEAVRWIKMAVDQGSARGFALYGQLFQNGEGIDKNMEEAIKYFKLAADANDSLGLLNYASCLASGDGIDKNTKEAATYFKRAADQGDDTAMLEYARLCMEGEDMEHDEQEGAKYYRLAAEDRNPEGCYQYSLCLKQGIGVPENQEKSLHYLQMAAELGHSDAKTVLQG